MTDDEYDRRALDLQERIAMMSDDELRATYLASDEDDPWQSALAAECEARGIDL
jgi:hypothetical protein